MGMSADREHMLGLYPTDNQPFYPLADMEILSRTHRIQNPQTLERRPDMEDQVFSKPPESVRHPVALMSMDQQYPSFVFTVFQDQTLTQFNTAKHPSFRICREREVCRTDISRVGCGSRS